jgi:hypothetical protein
MWARLRDPKFERTKAIGGAIAVPETRKPWHVGC